MSETIEFTPKVKIFVIIIVWLFLSFIIIDTIENKSKEENEKIKKVCQQPFLYGCEVLKNVSEKCESAKFEYEKKCPD